MNTNFADLVNNALVFAPEMLNVNGRTIVAPTASDYAAAGYWPVSETHPAPEAGKHEVEGTPTKVAVEHERDDEVEVEDGVNAETGEMSTHRETVKIHWTTYEINRVWTLVEDEVVPRVFDKWRLFVALTEAGKWDAFKAWLTDAGFWDAFSMADELAEDSDYFASGVAAAKDALGLTDDEVAAILAASVKEG